MICRIPAHNNTSYFLSGSQSPDGLSMGRSFARGKGEFITRAGGARETVAAVRPAASVSTDNKTPSPETHAGIRSI